jgi:3'(2'), 5'-bisphosphate nucleotidase
LADELSQTVIAEGLRKLFPKIPIISEETEAVSFSERKGWEYFWLIDPLDGTKEFIEKNTAFTVNITLRYKTCPVFGMISAPVLGDLYFACKAKSAFKRDRKGKVIPLKVKETPRKKIVIARSRSHAQKEEE